MLDVKFIFRIDSLDVCGRVTTILFALLWLKDVPPSRSAHPINATPVDLFPVISIELLSKISAPLYSNLLFTIIPFSSSPESLRIPPFVILNPPLAAYSVPTSTNVSFFPFNSIVPSLSKYICLFKVPVAERDIQI